MKTALTLTAYYNNNKSHNVALSVTLYCTSKPQQTEKWRYTQTRG